MGGLFNLGLPLLNHLDLQFTGIGAESIGALEGALRFYF
jgi:hypothetical protein